MALAANLPVLAGAMMADLHKSGVHLTVAQIALGLAAALVLAVVIIFIIYKWAVRGSWVIDSQGIGFQPRRGRGCCCDWKDVEWVKWTPACVILLGHRRRIGIVRENLPESDWKRIQKRVETMLSGRFDLTLEPRRLPPLIHEIKLWRGLALLIPILLALLLLGIPTLLVYLKHPLSLSLMDTLCRAGVFIMLMEALSLYTIVIICGVSRHRQLHELNPTWRAAKKRVDDWADY